MGTTTHAIFRSRKFMHALLHYFGGLNSDLGLSLLLFSLNIQCPSLNRITLGQLKRDNNNRMIQFTDFFCVLGIMGPVIFYYNKRLILLSVIQLSGGHALHSHILLLVFQDTFYGLQCPKKWNRFFDVPKDF